MEDLIIFKDSYAVKRSTIQRMFWGGKEGQKVLEIVFADPAVAATGKNWWKLDGEEALYFWEQYTGQKVSWDDRAEWREL